MQTFVDRTNDISGDLMDSELPTRWLKNSIVVNRDFSMGIAWKVTFPYLPTLGENQTVNFYASLKALLNSLPPIFDLQFIFDQHHKPDSLVSSIKTGLSDNAISRQLVVEKAETVQAAYRRGDLRMMDGYVILVRKSSVFKGTLVKRAKDQFKKGQDGVKPGLLDRLLFSVKAALRGAEESYQLEEREFEQASNELIQQAEGLDGDLTSMKLAPKVLLNDEVIELFYRFWNPISFDQGGRPRPFDEDDELPLTDYYLRGSLKWNTSGIFELDGAFHRLLTVRTPSSAMHFTQWNNLLLHRGMHNLRLIVNIQQGDVKKRIKTLRDHRLPQLRNQAKKDASKLSTVLDVESELIDLGKDREKIWHATHVIHVWGDSVEQVNRLARNVRKYGEEQDGLILTEEDYNVWGYWRLCQPFWTRDFDRYRDIIYNTSQLITQLPVVGQVTALEQVKGSGYEAKPLGAVFETTARTVFNFFPFGKEFVNWNGIVIGGSGTGKSFLVADIIAQMGRHRPISIIIDLGGSFRAMCEAQNGLYIDMDVNSTKHCINPLYIPPGHTPDPAELNQMLAFLEKLIVDPSRDANGRLGKEQMEILARALDQLINSSEGQEFFLKDFKATLSGFTGGASLAARMSPWCGKGRYANLFDGPTTLDLNNPFTVFDLTKVTDDMDLACVMFATIINQVMMLGAKDPSRLKFLCFDEAWKILQDPVLASFIVYAYRALRKAGYSTLAISQGIEEFQKTSNRSAILNSISHLIVLRQNSIGAAQDLAREFDLSPQETDYITKLQSQPGRFSQSMIRQRMEDGSTRSVITVNRPSPLSYWCCTTNPQDRGLLSDYISRMGWSKALVTLSKEYPFGHASRRAEEPPEEKAA